MMVFQKGYDSEKARSLPGVITARMRMAFPELSRCCTWVGAGLDAGAAWQPLLERYAAKIAAGRAARLLIETEDARVLQRDLPDEMDILLWVLGWEPRWFTDEAPDARTVLAHVADSVRAVQ